MGGPSIAKSTRYSTRTDPVLIHFAIQRGFRTGRARRGPSVSTSDGWVDQRRQRGEEPGRVREKRGCHGLQEDTEAFCEYVSPTSETQTGRDGIKRGG